jgi:hypothetical protein
MAVSAPRTVKKLLCTKAITVLLAFYGIYLWCLNVYSLTGSPVIIIPHDSDYPTGSSK